MYDFLEAVQNRFDQMYSYGGEVQRSFWQNVGKIVNKKAFAEKSDDVFSTINKTAEAIMNNNYKERK